MYRFVARLLSLGVLDADLRVVRLDGWSADSDPTFGLLDAASRPLTRRTTAWRTRESCFPFRTSHEPSAYGAPCSRDVSVAAGGVLLQN